MADYLYGSPGGVTVSSSSSSGYIPNLRKRKFAQRSLATLSIRGPDDEYSGGTTTHTTRNLGVIRLGGQKQPFKEKIFRQLYPPTTLEGRNWSVFQSNPGEWSYNYRPFLPTGYSFFSSGSGSASNSNTTYLGTSDALLAATNTAIFEDTDVAASTGNSYGNPAQVDTEGYVDRYVETHTFWNNSTVTTVIELYCMTPKVALAPSIGAMTNFLTECASNIAETTQSGSQTLKYNDVYWKPTSSLLFNNNWKIVTKKTITLAPGEQGRLSIIKGRVLVRKNETAQGYYSSLGNTVPDNVNWLPGRSFVTMCRARGVFVHDTTISATIDAVGGFTTGPASIHWDTHYRAVINGRYRQGAKRISNGAYGTVGRGTVSMLPVGAFTDACQFVNQATDQINTATGTGLDA